MNFTETEISVLKNFASIAESMMIRPDRFEIVNNEQSCIAKYPFENPYEFEPYGIYNLAEFLSVLGLMKNPEITVNEKFLVIKQGTNKVKYFTTPENMIPEVKSADKKFEKIVCELKFSLPAEKLNSIFKASSVLNSAFLFFESDKKKVRLTLADQLESSSSSFEVLVDDNIEANSLTKAVKIPVHNLKLFPGDYKVELSEKGISRWSCFNNVTYYIGVSDKP